MFKILALLKNVKGLVQGYKTYVVIAIAVLNLLAESLGMTVSWANGGIGFILLGQGLWKLWGAVSIMTLAAKGNRIIEGMKSK